MQQIYEKIKDIECFYFDFDGTLSNTAIKKKKAFFRICNDVSNLQIEYILNSLDGRPREEIINKISEHSSLPYETLICNFTNEIKNIYSETPLDKNIFKLKEIFNDVEFNIISSAPIKDIEKTLVQKNARHLFNNIIRPISKRDYFINCYENKNVLFFGDGPQDFNCSNLDNVDYIHLSQWSDFVPTDKVKCLVLNEIADFIRLVKERL